MRRAGAILPCQPGCRNAAEPNGSVPNLDKAGETTMDVTAYAAHMAALLGAHVIKVKPPSNVLWQPEAKAAYEKAKIDISTLAKRIEHVMQATFAGRRIVVFSGGEAKDLEGLFTEIRGLRDGGANGQGKM